MTRMMRLKRQAQRRARRIGIAGEKMLSNLERIGVSPASLLDAGSRVAGDRSRHLAHGVAYGPDARQRLDIWAPKEGEGPWPVMVFFYGGGWVTGHRSEFAFVARALATKGYLVVMPDYRLAPTSRFPDFVEDGADVLKWVEDDIHLYGGDAERLAIGGHSAGGHLAALLLLDPQYLRAATVSPRLVKAGVLLSAPMNFYPFSDPRPIAALGHWPNPEQTQPISFARGDAPPLFIGHGKSDIVVRARNSQQMARAIEAKGGAVELKIYEGAGHSDPIKAFSPIFRKKLPLLDDVSEFLGRRLG